MIRSNTITVRKNHALRASLHKQGLINPYRGLPAADLDARGYHYAASAVRSNAVG